MTPAVGSAGLTSHRSRLETWPGWVVAVAILVVSRAFSAAVVLGAWVLRIPSSPFSPWAAPFSM
ncbi:MAG TPA: hypothetical protein VET90_01665, partial [Candidatus Binatus sp.]|nr:hypothetical protein [Candidatus Binatus sp.]